MLLWNYTKNTFAPHFATFHKKIDMWIILIVELLY